MGPSIKVKINLIWVMILGTVIWFKEGLLDRVISLIKLFFLFD